MNKYKEWTDENLARSRDKFAHVGDAEVVHELEREMDRRSYVRAKRGKKFRPGDYAWLGED